MAQQKMLLGHVKGDKGDAGTNGKDAKIASATATATATHLDSPTVAVEVGGSAGAQTLDFTFTGLMGPKGETGTPGSTGPAGPAGIAAKISTVTVTVDGTHSDEPTCTASISGDAGDQTLTLAFTGLMGATGARGEAGATGPAGPAGTNATTTELASEEAPGLLRQLSGQEDQVLLGTGEWGEYHGGGGSGITIGNDASPSAPGAKDGDVYLNKSNGLLSQFGGGKWSPQFLFRGASIGDPSTMNISQMSFDEIKAASVLAANDRASYLRMVGQTKTIQLSGIDGVTNVTMKLIDVAHDIDGNGNPIGFSFQLTDGLVYTGFTMNSSNVTTGGWGSSLMRSTNLSRVYSALPGDLREVITQAKKKSNTTGSGTSTSDTIDNIWLLSYVEVFGDAQGYASDGSHNWLKAEGTWYEWYKQHNTNADRVIKQASGSANVWWLRSVYSSTHFCYVISDGSWNYSNASNTYLPCAGFAI